MLTCTVKMNGLPWLNKYNGNLAKQIQWKLNDSVTPGQKNPTMFVVVSRTIKAQRTLVSIEHFFLNHVSSKSMGWLWFFKRSIEFFWMKSYCKDKWKILDSLLIKKINYFPLIYRSIVNGYGDIKKNCPCMKTVMLIKWSCILWL